MKKKLLVAVAAMLCLLLILTGCGKKNATTFGDGTQINGQNVSGMTVEAAAQALAEAPKDYAFHLTMGEHTYEATAEEMQMTYNTEADLQSLLDAQNKDGKQLEFQVDDLYQVDCTALLEQISSDFGVELPAPAEEGTEGTDEAEAAPEEETPAEAPAEDAAPAEADTTEETDGLQVLDANAPKNAGLVFDETADAYVIVPDEDGLRVDMTVVIEQVRTAIQNVTPELELDMAQFAAKAEVTADNADLAKALEEANARLGLSLTYTFAPQGGTAASETIGRDLLSKVFYYNAVDGKLAVDGELLGQYVADLSSKHTSAGKATPFRTTGGGTININVAQAGSSVDTEKLYNDLLDCLLNNVGGTREAAYATQNESDAGYWGGNYVEIDQTSQHMWVYRNGQQVVSCDMVSGCVANNTRTPNGCFKIFAKDRSRYLQGSNVNGSRYKAWVDYFMPFSGGCGIHDASWRGSFGGSIYLYNGSHGCVGVTKSNAKKIFDNVSVGTHVVVYGGMSPNQLPSKKPTLSFAQSEYTIEVGQTLDLGITTNSDGATQLKANKGGIVEVLDGRSIRGVAEGTVTITCTTAVTPNFKEGSARVTVHVVAAKPQESAQSISASAGTTSLTVGGSSTQISVSGNATSPVFSSENGNVIRVDGSGVVTPVGAGTAKVYITCPAGNGYKEGSTSITFTVSAPAAKEQNISASAGTTSLTVGGSTTQISVSGNATSPTFSVENDGVVSVSSSGVVTPVGAGTTKVYITCPAGSGYAEGTTSITFTVSAQQEQHISASATTTELTVGGASAQINVSGNHTTPRFTVNTSGVVQVSDNGVVTPVGAGTVIVTITCPAGSGYKEARTSITFTVRGA